MMDLGTLVIDTDTQTDSKPSAATRKKYLFWNFYLN